MKFESPLQPRNDLEKNEGVERNLGFKMEIQQAVILSVCGYDDPGCIEAWIRNPTNSETYNAIFQQMLKDDPYLETRWREDSQSVLLEIKGLLERKQAA